VEFVRVLSLFLHMFFLFLISDHKSKEGISDRKIGGKTQKKR